MRLGQFIERCWSKVLTPLRASAGLGRFLLYRDPRGYWQKRGGEQYFREQESRDDRTKTSLFLAREISLLNPQSILEVGCGYGKNLKSLRQFTKAPMTGVDFSQSQLQKAREYLEDFQDIRLFEADATRLNFPDNSFDVVFTCNVILHNPPETAKRIWTEILRVSKRFVVHKEDINVNYSRFGYDHAAIYREMGLKVHRAEKIDSAIDADITQFVIAEKSA